MSRFQLRGYHAVFHINGTETRQYCDGHNCEGQRLAQKQASSTSFSLSPWPVQALVLLQP
jgi:hypothetical protein